MTKALNVSEDVYLLVFNKWVELKSKGENIGIGKVAELFIKAGFDSLYKNKIKLVQEEDILKSREG